MASSSTRLKKQPGPWGFTLLELSIVLVIIAVVIGGGLAIFTSSLQASQYNATVKRMDEIEKALLDFGVAHNRIPCPSDLTQTASSTTFGYEAGAGAGSTIGTATGACNGSGMSPQANFLASSGAAEGGVPTRALQLPDEYMYDGWGRRFRYAVDPGFTASGALPFPAGGQCSPSKKAITVNDSSGSARTTGAIYALISHGANGHGAYTSSGAIFSDGSVNADELTNCHCNSSGWAQTYAPTYVEKMPMEDAANALDNFDDIVTFKEAWQMQAANFPLSSPLSCPYLAVVGNAAPYLALYNFNGGNLIALPPPTITPNGQGLGVDFSPDNSLLAWAGASSDYSKPGLLYNVTSAGLTGGTALYPGLSSFLMGAKFSPDGNYLAAPPPGTVAQQGMLQKSGSTYTTAGVSGMYEAQPGATGGIAWSPDSSTLYYAGTYATYDVYTHSGGSFTHASTVNLNSSPMVNGGSYFEGGTSIDSTGKYLAISMQVMASGYSAPDVISNPATSPSGIDTTTSGLSGCDIPTGLAWSPDGMMLAAGCYNHGIYVFTFNPAASPPFITTDVSNPNCSGYASSIAWSKDSQYFAIVTGGSTNGLCVYARSGSTFTNIVNPSSNPSLMPGIGNLQGVAFSK